MKHEASSVQLNVFVADLQNGRICLKCVVLMEWRLKTTDKLRLVSNYALCEKLEMEGENLWRVRD